MTTLQNARPEARARADSLSRMLELEKKYKLQRLQDTGSSPPPSHTPLARANTRSSSSAQPDSALKARRASAHPPISHQKAHMMLNTTRRGSGMPPLSISVPPSLTSTTVLAVRAEDSEAAFHALGSPGERPKETLERTKTVTFSEPEEDEEDDDDNNNLSDQSSICQSPSWQVYGQKKQKSKKREVAQRKKEQERQEKLLRSSAKKRLSKPAPKSDPETRPAHPERALSAPELVESQKLGERSLNHSTSHYPPDSMANHHHLRQQSVDSSTKPKSRGFFSSLRFSSSNSIPTQKAEVEDANQNMEDADLFKGNPAFPGQAPGLGSDMRFLNPRKPPSINSTQSSSTRSQNSLERQSVKGRASFSHSRSNSLLAKIRGPSYLYAKNSGPTEETGSKRPESSGNLEVKPKPTIRGQNSNQAVLVGDDFQRTDTQEEGNSRGRPILAHVPRPRDPSSDYEDTHITESGRHYGEPVVPNIPVANESRHRPLEYLGQTTPQHQTLVTIPPPLQVDDDAEDLANVVQETRCNFPHLSQPAQSIRHQVAIFDQPTPAMSPESSKSYATIYTDAVDRLSESHSPYKEEDLFPPPAQVSATFPGLSQKDGAKLTDVTHEPYCLPNTGLAEVGADRPLRAGSAKTTKISSNARVDPVDHLPQSPGSQTGSREHKREKSTDYFAFISESYAPPSLELRSPVDEEKQSYHSTEEKIIENDCEVADMTWATLPIRALIHGNEDLIEAEASSCSPNLSKEVKDSDACDSPTLSAHDEVSIKLEKKNQHFGMPLGEELSQSVSEQSSSSTCDDPLFSPTVTTPDNSRPQSQHDISDDDLNPVANESRVLRGSQTNVREVYRSKVLGLSQRSASQDTMMQSAPPQITEPTSPRSKYMAQIPSPNGTRGFDISSEMPEDLAPEKMPSPRRQRLTAKAQSAIDLGRSASSLSGNSSSSIKPKNKAGLSSASLPNSPPPETDPVPPPPHRSALKIPRNSSSTSQGSTTILSSGAYLQEARKAALVTNASSRALRGVQRQRPPPPHLNSSTSSNKRGEPMAKVLVECCNCHFFHDMPSRVYECMAKPDSIVEDKQLGVSAAITTTVKCPWCTHGMTTQCCSGYAAMVYLKEKLHGQ